MTNKWIYNFEIRGIDSIKQEEYFDDDNLKHLKLILTDENKDESIIDIQIDSEIIKKNNNCECGGKFIYSYMEGDGIMQCEDIYKCNKCGKESDLD
jgi:hypothetical protein